MLLWCMLCATMNDAYCMLLWCMLYAQWCMLYAIVMHMLLWCMLVVCYCTWCTLYATVMHVVCYYEWCILYATMMHILCYYSIMMHVVCTMMHVVCYCDAGCILLWCILYDTTMMHVVSCYCDACRMVLLYTWCCVLHVVSYCIYMMIHVVCYYDACYMSDQKQNIYGIPLALYKYLLGAINQASGWMASSTFSWRDVIRQCWMHWQELRMFRLHASIGFQGIVMAVMGKAMIDVSYLQPVFVRFVVSDSCCDVVHNLHSL
jgi:hypothetical protein